MNLNFRYWLFMSSIYYPSGGFNDLQETSNDILELHDCVERNLNIYTESVVQIFDNENKEIVYECDDLGRHDAKPDMVDDVEYYECLIEHSFTFDAGTLSAMDLISRNEKLNKLTEMITND